MPTATILQAMADKTLFARWFSRNWCGADTWRTWKVFLGALFALPLDAEERELYRKFTGREDLPTEQSSEAWLICGRRAGKSRVAALIAVFLACFRDYSGILAPGEIGTVMVICPDKKQARVVLGYIAAFFGVPILRKMLESRTLESLTLANSIRIEVHAGSFKSVRGYTVVAAILDEVAFFPTGDSANPDEELVHALRPAMVTVPGSLMIALSSPYSRRGVLWNAFRECYGKAGAPALVWKADTRSMNPGVSHAVIAAAYLRDSVAASAEFGAEFRTDLAGFITREIVDARVVPGRYELAPRPGVSYSAFVDPSGGSSDSMTLAVSHREQEKAILDLLREVRPPFSPEGVVGQFAADLKRYRVSKVIGDAYAGEWPREQFQKLGINYKVSEMNRSELYLELLPGLMSGTVELLDNPQLVQQLCGLERRTARSGKDSVDHSPGAHDDIANAAAGAVVQALGEVGPRLTLWEWQSKIYDTYLATGKTEQEQLEEATKVQLPAPIVSASVPAANPALTCPQCGGSGCIVERGPLYHHNVCGHDWPISPTNPDAPVGQRRAALADLPRNRP